MRVLVTGGTGFIGRHLVRALIDRGDTVTALVRSPSKASVLPPGVALLQGDLALFGKPDTVLEPQDVVIHLAGVVTSNNPAEYEAINYTAVTDLLSCLERQTWTPRRVLFASSLAAAGPSEAGRPWTEQDEPRPREAYGDAKARAETACWQSPLPVTSFRPGVVLGPEDSATLTLYKAASWGVGFRVAGQIQQLSWIDVRDLVTAILACADDPRDGDHCYFVNHTHDIGVDELWAAMGQGVGKRVRVLPVPAWVLFALVPIAALLARITGKLNQLDEKEVQQIVAPYFQASSEALRTELAWQPRYSLTDATTHAVEGYRAAAML